MNDRARFKSDPAFTQLDCELELRRGDTTRALALTQELDAQSEELARRPAPPGPGLRRQGPVPRGRRRLRRGPGPQPQAARSPAPARPAQPQGTARPTRPSARPASSRTPTPTQPTGLAALLVEARGRWRSQTGTPAQVQANRTRRPSTEARQGRRSRPGPTSPRLTHLTAEIHLHEPRPCQGRRHAQGGPQGQPRRVPSP